MELRGQVTFLSLDDKCKLSLGEPGYPLAAVSRGKKVDYPNTVIYCFYYILQVMIY